MRYEIYIRRNRKPEGFYIDAISEYEKRLGPFCRVSWKTVRKEKEWDRLIARLQDEMPSDPPGNDTTANVMVYRILPGPSDMSSLDLAGKMEGWEKQGRKKVVFLVDNDRDNREESRGLPADVKESHPVGRELSVSCFDMDPAMTGMILMEQIYRGYRILNNQPYHK